MSRVREISGLEARFERGDADLLLIGKPSYAGRAVRSAHTEQILQYASPL